MRAQKNGLECSSLSTTTSFHLEKIADVPGALFEEAPMQYAQRFVDREDAIAAREASGRSDMEYVEI